MTCRRGGRRTTTTSSSITTRRGRTDAATDADTTEAATTTEATTTTTTTPTPTTESSDDLYIITAKALIDAGTCDTVVASINNCGDDAISYFKDFEYNGERVIISSGIPDHEAEHDMLVSNPNTRCEHWQYMVVPLSQSQASSSVATGLGVVGLSTTGGHFFNHLSNPDGSLALTNEGPTLDSCFGHSAASGLYHYHANINCTTTGTNKVRNQSYICCPV